MKTRHLLLSCILFITFSCHREEIKPNAGFVEFAFEQLSTGGGRTKTTPSFVLLSITDQQGTPVEANLSLQLFSFGAGYLSESASLAPGTYKLTKFVVLDSDHSAMYASPLEGTDLAGLVDDPLPIVFTITENGSTQIVPEVLRVDEDSTPTEFGYAAFGFTVVAPQGSTVTDVEGNIYHTVTIGTQVWMVENLKVTKYNDGTPIPLVTDPILWDRLNSAAYCWYDNNANYSNSNYGAIYNWYTVNTGKLAPAGWHVPTSTEWQTLIDYAGGDNVAGTKLKVAGSSDWFFNTVPATNDFGFSALPAGARVNSGVFANIHGSASFWHSNDENSWGGAATHMQLVPITQVVKPFNKELGNSVRLIKD